MRIHINARTGLGDSVYFLSILQTITRVYPDAEISLICWNVGEQLYMTVPAIKNIINANDVLKQLGAKWTAQTPKAQSFFKERIGAVDYYIDLQPAPNYGAELALVPAEKRVAVNPDPAVSGNYDVIIQTAQDEQIILTYRRMLNEVFGITEYAEVGDIPVPQELKDKAAKVVDLISRKGSRRLAGVHPGAKAHEKLWDVFKWGKVVNYLIDAGFQPVLFGSNLRMSGQLPILDVPFAEAIHRLSFDRAFNMAGQTEHVLILAALIGHLSLYIGLDTGPTHIASVCGIPTLELFWKQSDHQFATWKAYGSSVQCIASADMRAITAEQVVDLLAGWNCLRNG
jgi:ADP-heptose:LPS heptosyltransferase